MGWGLDSVAYRTCHNGKIDGVSTGSLLSGPAHDCQVRSDETAERRTIHVWEPENICERLLELKYPLPPVFGHLIDQQTRVRIERRGI